MINKVGNTFLKSHPEHSEGSNYNREIAWKERSEQKK